MATSSEKIAALEVGLKHLEAERHRETEMWRDMFVLHQESTERIIEKHNASTQAMVVELGKQMAAAVETASNNMKVETNRWISSFWALIKAASALNGTVLVIILGALFGGGPAIKSLLEILK